MTEAKAIEIDGVLYELKERLSCRICANQLTRDSAYVRNDSGLCYAGKLCKQCNKANHLARTLIRDYKRDSLKFTAYTERQKVILRIREMVQKGETDADKLAGLLI